MEKEGSQKKILDFMQEGAYKPMSLKELVHFFDVRKEERDRFKKIIKDMAREGTLIKIRGGRYGLPSKMNLVTGELISHPDGFGFVRPEEGGDDVFISPRRLAGAMHGDTVVTRVEASRNQRGKRAMRGKREGTIIRILKRANKLIVGRFEWGRGFGTVIPSDERITQQVIIPPAEAKNAEEGMIVSAEVVKWPERNLAAVGKIIEVIGRPEDPNVEAAVILKKYGLPNRFPADVMYEVKDVPSSVAPHESKDRVDLRNKLTITIDGETAKDFDDAVSIDKLPNGGYRLRVSIADVAYYVRENTLVDREAYARGTSVYFPDRCIPMLPEALSNGICSLNPNEDRLTMTAEVEFNSHGDPVKKKLYESVIKSAERMTYTNVKKLLYNEDEALNKRYSHIIEDLKIMAELAEKLKARRMEAGSIDFDLPEPQIIIDIEGRIEDIVKSERNVAHRLIEEFMLAANKAVAEQFSSLNYPFLYRVHEEPSEESIDEFIEFAASFGIHFKKAGGPKAFQKALQSVEGKPEERLINQVLLRSMKQAVYSEENIGHFGLAFENYTHFTSPIRRYPDLVVHRLLRKFLHGKYTKEERDRMENELPPIAGHTSARERKAMEAEREIDDLKKCQFMQDKVGEEFEGFISGVTSFGLFVELKEYYVEGLIHVSTLADDYYVFDEKRHCLMGENAKRRFRLADEVKVVITRVDLERRRIDLLLAEEFQRTIKQKRKKGARK